MLFRVLVVSLVCLALGHADIFRRYPSQTILQMVLHPSDKVKVCECSGGKCKINEKAAETMCQSMKERFLFFAYPSTHFMTCEISSKSCTEMIGTAPKHVIFDLIFDDYYLKTAPFFYGPDTARRVFDQMMYRKEFPILPGFEQTPISSQLQQGITSMPVEFWGILNMKVADSSKFELCVERSCLEALNKFCDEFIAAMKAKNPSLMSQSMGCHIRRIYPVGQDVRMTWSIMLHHRQLIETNVVKTFEDLEKQINLATTNLKLPSLLKSYKLTGFVPLDYCEISATAQTTQRYHPYVSDPTSYRYRTDSHAYYSRLFSQLVAGDNQMPSCIRRAMGLNFSDNNGLAKLSVGLWISMTCYKKRGMNNCQEATQDIAKIWKRGRDIMYSDWTPEYEFKLTHEGKSFKV